VINNDNAVVDVRGEFLSIRGSRKAYLDIRVLTTSARKPPLRTDKFAALWRIAAPVHPIRSTNCAESGTAHSFIPEKASRATMKRVNGPKWRGQTAKAQSLASKPPILTEVFGWMWSAREEARQCSGRVEKNALTRGNSRPGHVAPTWRNLAAPNVDGPREQIPSSTA
jgi:hypothetical protein